MSANKNILEILYNAFDRLSEEDLVIDKFYIEQDGDMLHVANLLNDKYRDVFNSIKKLNKTKLQFSIAYQDGMLKASFELSGSALKILMYMISKMKYRNSVFDFKYNDMVEMFGMSYSTVTKAMKELIDKKYVKVDGKRTNRVYHISPAVVWKGSVYSMYEKIKMFVEDE